MATAQVITTEMHEHDLQAAHCQRPHASLLGNKAGLM